jgi:ribonuclease BN (tRNA processing enzyme)
LGYAFEAGGHKVVYATDSELDLLLDDPTAPERDPESPRRLPDELVSFCRGADLLISDGQYTDEEYRSKAGWGHARATTVADLAVQAGVRQLALFHHDPMHADRFVDDMVATVQQRTHGQGSEVFVFGAREGVEIRIGD